MSENFILFIFLTITNILFYSEIKAINRFKSPKVRFEKFRINQIKKFHSILRLGFTVMVIDVEFFNNISKKRFFCIKIEFN